MDREGSISIIIPVFNVEQYLDECLLSAVNQTYRNIEIVVINDGSTDSSSDICEEWARKDARIKVIHQENGGLSVARNTGIEYAKGQYICFLDSDDYLVPDCCEKIIKSFLQYNIDMVSFGFFRDQDYALQEDTQRPTGVLCACEALDCLLRGRIDSYVWTCAYRREIFEDIRFPEGRNFEDIGTMYRLILAASNILFMENKLYYYRYRRNSISDRISNKSCVDLFVMRKTRYDDIRKEWPELAEFDFMNMAIVALNLYARSCYSSLDESVLVDALKFLSSNREKVLSKVNLMQPNLRMHFRCFYANQYIYHLYCVSRHSIGSVIKRLIGRN